MKRKLIGMCVAVCMTGAVWGEIIQTVGYNPARFGEYKRLKVTSGMETGGALVSPTLDGNGRSVTLSACEGECDEAAYRVERIESENNGTVTSTGMTAGSVNGARGTVNVGNNSEIKSAVKGGEVAVKQLSASGSGLSVSENLTLGGNKIKKPGYKNCQWKWETITHEGGSAKVLALAGCEGVIQCDDSKKSYCSYSGGGYVKGQWNAANCTCICPEGSSLDSVGHCAEACVPTTLSSYVTLSAKEAQEKMAHVTSCRGDSSGGWKYGSTPYSCPGGVRKYCRDAYRASSTRKGVFTYNYVSGNSIQGINPNLNDCGGSQFYIGSWATAHPPINIDKWLDMSLMLGGYLAPTSVTKELAQRLCEQTVPSSLGAGVYGIYYCAPQGQNIYGYKAAVFGYCEVDYDYKYADVVCCP